MGKERERKMNEKKYPPGMSPDEMAKAFSEAMDKEHEATEKLPKVFKKGEMLEEVPGDDDAMGDH